MTTPELPYLITFEERPRYLFARVTAEQIDRETVLSYFRDLAKKCEATRSDRLMIDRRIRSVMSEADYYFVVSDMPRIFGRVRIAFVNPIVSNEHAMRFADMVSGNRGYPYRLFQTEPEAESWLVSDDPL